MFRSFPQRSRRHSSRADRSLRIEMLESRQLLDGHGVVAVDDLVELQQNGPQQPIDVLANDQFDPEYPGAGQITSVSYGSQGGRIEIDDDQLLIFYTPPADYSGTETFVYAIDGQYTGTVSVAIQSPLEDDHYDVPPDGITRALDVLANDPFWENYAGQRQITSVSVGSQGGTVEIGPDAGDILYTPPEGGRGSESFIYIVDELYAAHVEIEIPDTLQYDAFELVHLDPPTTLDVLANDPFWANYPGERRITHITESALGANVEIAPDGLSLVYSQSDNGYGTDSFRYVVDGTYEASVSVRVNRPVKDDWFDVDENSTEYFYDVTSNDTYRDRDGVTRDVIDRVTGVTQPDSGGTASIAPGGIGILYWPPAGFTGTDSFTYLADGLHEAYVTVQVTRPVRDDYFYSGVYQDTPDNVLNVLSNDFRGNGYQGPKLITAVGPTENGGELTIRDDGRAIYYTPTPGYTGMDRFEYTVDGQLQAHVVVSVQALAQHDGFSFCPALDAAYSLPVLANDYFDRGYQGFVEITAAEILSGGGTVSIEGSTLRFSPDSTGYATLSYTVDGQYQAQITVSIREHLTWDQYVVDQNSPATSLDVLANDFIPDHHYAQCRSQDYVGPRLITSTSPSVHGGTVTVSNDGSSVTYQPPEDFTGADTFTYMVDDLMVETVTVQVIRRVRDDLYRVDSVDGPAELSVLVNDMLGADYRGPGQITHITTPSGGIASIAEGGRAITYAPADGFVGTDALVYTVDGGLKAEVQIIVDQSHEDHLPTFGGSTEFQQFLIDDAIGRYQHLFGSTAFHLEFTGDGDFSGSPTAGGNNERSHSETNVQVAGVDEGDIVEFDSDYVYLVTNDGAVILDAWPAEQLHVESRVEIEGRPLVEYLHGDRLTVISETGGGDDYPIFYGDPISYDDPTRGGIDFIGDGFGFRYPPFEPEPYTTIVTVLDVSDRAEPAIVQTSSLEGQYIDSRGVGDYVYVLVNNNNAVAPKPEVIDEDDDPLTLGRYETEAEYLARVTANAGELIEAALPNYASYGPDGEMARTGLLNLPEDIYQPLLEDARNLISIVSFNVDGDLPGLAETAAVYSTGASNIYASLDNFYVFDRDYSAEDGPLTRIAKFDWDPETGGIDFAATTHVAGSILNQFSADENGPFLRIATTVSNAYAGNWTGREENTLFVLEEDDGILEFVGSLKNLALDESIRSVRFMGDRAFVTTFREIDPLFALDLTDPTNPQSVGHVTLPGFTSYVHLIGEDQLLTVGKNTPGGGNGPTQASIFDISDMTQPLRIAEYTFPRFSSSEAEIDHHAFGYYAEHGLLGMPVATYRVERIDADGDGYRETSQTVREDRLAVFAIDVDGATPAERLELVSEIVHDSPVRRSGYIGDKLYSVARDSVSVVAVDNPAVVLAEAVVASPDGPPLGDLIDISIVGARDSDPATQRTVYAAIRDDADMLAAVGRARVDLAGRLGQSSAAPLLVSVEAAESAAGGGLKIVFEANDQLYLYRSNDDGVVQLAAGAFDFDNDGVWNSAASLAIAPPVTFPGDYDRSGAVGGRDFLEWQRSVGDEANLPGDGTQDGRVDAGDLGVWEARLGDDVTAGNPETGDYHSDGRVTGLDFLAWQRKFGATDFLTADFNRDGDVDGDDLNTWAANAGSRNAEAISVPGDFAGDGTVSGDDFLLWQRSINSESDLSADGNRNGLTDAQDLAIWAANYAAPPAPAAAASVAENPSHDAVLEQATRDELPLQPLRRRNDGSVAAGKVDAARRDEAAKDSIYDDWESVGRERENR